jgi:hypothetical protein
VEEPPLGVEPEEEVEGAEAVLVLVLVLVDELVLLLDGVEVLEESPFLVLE